MHTAGPPAVHMNFVRHTPVFTAMYFFSHNQQYGWTALHWASWNGHISTLHTLVGHSGCLVNVLDKTGSNPLHCAALNGHAGVVRVLVPMKCDVDQQRKDGWTPLHLACWNEHHEVVHALIVSRCKVNVRNDVGMGPLHLAAMKGAEEIVQELLDAEVAPDMQDTVSVQLFACRCIHASAHTTHACMYVRALCNASMDWPVTCMWYVVTLSGPNKAALSGTTNL